MVNLSGSLSGQIEEMLEGSVAGNVKLLSGKGNLIDLTVNANGTYEPSGDVDGYKKVVVEVPEPVLDDISITENGTYTPPTGVDGYNEINVAVLPILETLNVTENGTYTPPANVDGFNNVNVNTPSIHEVATLISDYSNNDSATSWTTTDITKYFFGQSNLELLNGYSIFCDLFSCDWSGSSYYKTTQEIEIVNDYSFRRRWGTQSGSSKQYYKVLFAKTNNIHLLADDMSFTGNTEYSFDLPSDVQNYKPYDFYVDFDSVETGGVSGTSYVTKRIENNKLYINLNIPSQNRSIHGRIIYVY